MVLPTIYFLDYPVCDLHLNHDCIVQKFDTVLQNQPQLNPLKILDVEVAHRVQDTHSAILNLESRRL